MVLVLLWLCYAMLTALLCSPDIWGFPTSVYIEVKIRRFYRRARSSEFSLMSFK